MNDKIFHGSIEKLRSQERRERLQIERVSNYCLCGQEIASVLDVGTGTGLFAEQFFRLGLKVKGIDCNEEFLKIAKEYVPGAEFKCAVAEKIPFDNSSFDLVFMGHVLHEVDDAEKAVSEAFRVARKRLAVLEWPYVEQSFGPPLEHRMKEEKVVELGNNAGFTCCDRISMRYMMLYIFDK
ncbi:MAG: hypothetical protein Kow0029_08880 [Candidatus Rifleibacteriota bacterium]